MTDFLTFLNTADLDTLTEIPGISRPLAGNIIAARPFDFVEDALHVKGMGKNLLGRMQSYFEEYLNESRAMVAVEQDSALLEKPQPKKEAPAPTPQQHSFFSRVWRGFASFLIGLLKLTLTLVLIAAIIAAAYFYVIPAFRQSLVAPVEQNTAQIVELSSQLAAIDEDLASMQSEIDIMNQRVETLEQTIETQTEMLSQLEQIQKQIEQEIETGNEAVMLELKREVMLTRALEYLSRGRLYLAQSNFGLVREDVQAAHDLTVQLKEMAPEYQIATLDEVITRLDLALKNLPEFPVIAINDVNIAWQILMNGLPESAEQAAFTLTPTSTTIATFTPTTSAMTPEVTITPTP